MTHWVRHGEKGMGSRIWTTEEDSLLLAGRPASVRKERARKKRLNKLGGNTWAVLLETGLLSSAAATLIYSGLDVVKHQSAYSVCVFVLIFRMTFWSFLHQRIRHQRWPD